MANQGRKSDKNQSIVISLTFLSFILFATGKNMNQKIENKFRDFFWNGLEDKKKVALIRWKKYVDLKK